MNEEFSTFAIFQVHCSMCHKLLMDGSGEILEIALIRALCQSCQEDYKIICVMSEERAKLEEEFKELINYDQTRKTN